VSGILVLLATACSSTAATTKGASSNPPAACAIIDSTKLGRLAHAEFGAPQTGGGSGWIVSQCTWQAVNGPSVSIAIGTSASLAATGFAGTVADFVAARQEADAARGPVRPIDDATSGGYYTGTPAPKFVGYRHDALVQVLTVDPGGRAVDPAVAHTIGTACLDALSR
jgi:hypothetical protein